MKDLKTVILEKSFEKDGKHKLSCAAAFLIAEELDIKVSEIGDICRKEQIKICKCQLKCFG